jgi:acyl-CoA hydrolase
MTPRPQPVAWPPFMWTTAAAAVARIVSGHRVFVHGGAATPMVLLQALAARAAELRGVELVHLHTEGDAPCAAPGLADSFHTSALFLGANIRDAVARGDADYVPAFLSEMPALFRQRVLSLRRV